MSIEVKNLNHVYMAGTPYEKPALINVSFSVRDGEFVGLIGHTGSGKSTLITHLNGLLRPTTGSIRVGGIELTDKNVDLREVRKKVGLVFQYPEYQLFEETVIKDVMFGPKNQGLSDSECRDRSQEALSLVGLDESLHEKSPFDLSGGQKRRVAIAGVLAMKPETLILDEPTAGLDPRGRDEIMGLMRDIHARGTTVIMVSHSMTDVSRLCGRVLVLSQGRLVMDGATAEVFDNPDALRKAGLDVPPCAELVGRLREQGFDIPKGVFTKEGLEQALTDLFAKETDVCR